MSKIPTSLPSNVAGLGSQIMTPPQYVKVSEITADSVMQHRAVTHDKVIEEYADVCWVCLGVGCLETEENWLPFR